MRSDTSRRHPASSLLSSTGAEDRARFFEAFETHQEDKMNQHRGDGFRFLSVASVALCVVWSAAVLLAGCATRSETPLNQTDVRQHSEGAFQRLEHEEKQRGQDTGGAAD